MYVRVCVVTVVSFYTPLPTERCWQDFIVIDKIYQCTDYMLFIFKLKDLSSIILFLPAVRTLLLLCIKFESNW